MTDDPMRDRHRLGGAVWCEGHQRWECTKNSKRTQVRCHAVALTGLDACYGHSGKRRDVAKAQGEAVTAWSALSGKAVISHTEAVLGMLQMSWLRVHLYAGLLEQQVTAAQAEAAREPADAGARTAVGAAVGVELDDPPAQGAPPVGHGVGLVGQTFSGVKDIGIFATGEALRGLTQLEAAERDRCVKFAKTAHDMGIAEREVQLAEQQGQLLAGVVGRVADGLLAAVVALLAGGADEVVRAAAEIVRQAWPAWVTEIVPRELRAAAGIDAA